VNIFSILKVSITLVALAFCLASTALAAPAQTATPGFYACENFNGGYIGPHTNWKSKADGAFDQMLLLDLDRTKREATAEWYLKMKKYSSVTGPLFFIQGGFVMVSVSNNDVETYTFNYATSDVMFTQTRINSVSLPNAIKSLHAQCALKRGPWELKWK
jgi:hypothetical protein